MTDAWEKLAKANNLIFKPARPLQSHACIVGQYRGYQLQMTDLRFTLEIVLSGADGQLFQDHHSVSEVILTLLTSPKLVGKLRGYFRATELGQKFYYHSIPATVQIDKCKDYLQQHLDQLCHLADAYRQVLCLGGEAIPSLQAKIAKHGLISNLTRQLFRDIEQDTTNRLGTRAVRLFCFHCLTRCQRLPVEIMDGALNKINFAYYGCRICGQSRDFFEGRVIMVLDRQMIKGQIVTENVLKINWLAWRILVDFDEVQIVQATDEDVERFAVQIGNDTEPARKPRYKTMRCWVAPDCHLSPNTMRILARIFGEVVIRRATSRRKPIDIDDGSE